MTLAVDNYGFAHVAYENNSGEIATPLTLLGAGAQRV